MILAIIIALTVTAGLAALWWAQNRQTGPTLVAEPCDTCAQMIDGDRCRVVQEGQDVLDGVPHGWAMVAYFHPTDTCCPLRDHDPTHVHAGTRQDA